MSASSVQTNISCYSVWLISYTNLKLRLHVDGGWSIAIWSCLASSVCHTTYVSHRQRLWCVQCAGSYNKYNDCLNKTLLKSCRNHQFPICRSSNILFTFSMNLRSLLNAKYVKTKNSSNLQRWLTNVMDPFIFIILPLHPTTHPQWAQHYPLVLNLHFNYYSTDELFSVEPNKQLLGNLSASMVLLCFIWFLWFLIFVSILLFPNLNFESNFMNIFKFKCFPVRALYAFSNDFSPKKISFVILRENHYHSWCLVYILPILWAHTHNLDQKINHSFLVLFFWVNFEIANGKW